MRKRNKMPTKSGSNVGPGRSTSLKLFDALRCAKASRTMRSSVVVFVGLDTPDDEVAKERNY